ncbi:MAG: ribosome small subunit-dependent GTPase A [Paracoccaceae bacterium]|nr:ribosome small subunit-dependent GTPase A [Paracoccaceae bacterium]
MITTPLALTLTDLGWDDHFETQLSDASEVPFRVTRVHRSALSIISKDGADHIRLFDRGTAQNYAVGDWVILGTRSGDAPRILERKTVIRRRAAGIKNLAQLIAANIDTVFIVSSCNDDFKIARLERYVAMAMAEEVEPVLLLTKADKVEDADTYRAWAREAFADVSILMIDARSAQTVETLAPWCGTGCTVALVGSSGVGKSTLTNLLTGRKEDTAEIREDDARGRHTTSARSMFPMSTGGCVVDTPGMRSLRLYDGRDGVDAVFPDIAKLSLSCQFNNCTHLHEPGCSLWAAVAAGTLDAVRVGRWQKLVDEDDRSTGSLILAAERKRTEAR